MTLTGKHALVTGGGTGIGLAIAQILAREGAQVTITGRRMQTLNDVSSKVGAEGLFPAVMDVTNETSVSATVEATVAERGPIQICVANAGIAEGGTLRKTDMAFWQRIMATNLDGAFLTIRECFKSMRDTDWGRVIAISSIAGVRGLRGAGAYSASKHGVIGLIRSFSEEHINDPYTFNALCPGYVETAIVHQNVARMKQKGMSREEALTKMLQSNRHARMIDANEIAEAALWLCAEGSKSVNGQAIEIAGGKV